VSRYIRISEEYYGSEGVIKKGIDEITFVDEILYVDFYIKSWWIQEQLLMLLILYRD
jgi:hypothetical protein